MTNTIDQHIGDRPTQQDRALIAGLHGATVAILADGIGGHARGDVAARLACKAALRLLRRRRSIGTCDMDDLPRHITDAIRAAQWSVNGLDGYPQPGCTLVIAIHRGHDVAIGHVGDSWARLGWRRVTMQHGEGRYLFSSVPNVVCIEAHTYAVPSGASVGERKLTIASDGLDEDTPGGTAPRLVQNQIARGVPGQDNVTAIVIDGTPLGDGVVVWAGEPP